MSLRAPRLWARPGVVLAQTARQAACNRKHGAQQRLGRWLLQARDLVGEDALALTHEYLAEMLGVRRASVSIEMEALRAAGLIAYHRGRVSILDAPGLERVACEDYRIIRGMYDHLRA